VTLAGLELQAGEMELAPQGSVTRRATIDEFA
jgi:hypothetical protein